MTTLDSALRQHLATCDALCRAISDENRHLRETGRPPEADALEQKRGLLDRLTEALDALRAASRDRGAATAHRDLIEKAQQAVLKSLVLDRENEQLILKCAIGGGGNRPAAPKPSRTHLQNLYGAAAK